MPMPLSEEMRKKIIYHKENGETEKAISKWQRISQSSITRIWRKYREQNTIEPKAPNKGRKPAFGEEVMKQIATKIKEQPDITLEELVETFGLKISISALSRKLRKLDLTFKKRHCFVKSNFVPMCSGYAANG